MTKEMNERVTPIPTPEELASMEARCAAYRAGTVNIVAADRAICIDVPRLIAAVRALTADAALGANVRAGGEEPPRPHLPELRWWIRGAGTWRSSDCRGRSRRRARSGRLR